MASWNPRQLLGMIPGADLLRQAWDATKLVGAIIDRRKEKALVLSEERHKAVRKYKDKQANKQVKELFLEAKYEELSRLYLPHLVVDKGKDLVEAWWKIWDIYWLFLILRIVLVFLPQSGYIHPDEFFQTVEVVVGDVFQTETTRTWEFNSTAPLRSMTINMLVFGTPLYFVKFMDWTLSLLIGWSIVTPYVVMVVPRLTMLCLTFLVDWILYQICILYKHRYNQCLTTLASSYVMLVYGTRTFSNSVELVLSSLLLYMIAHCMKRTAETVYLQSMVDEAYEKAETPREKVDIVKRRKLIPPHDFKFAVPISILCAVGFFNRPTFVAFAIIPLFYWFQRGVFNHSYITPFQMFNFRIISLVPGFVITSLIIILSDSLYYGELTLQKLYELSMNWSDWKCTPMHFVMYNLVPGNLDKHGTHPWYLHLGNLVILFGPLGLIGMWSAIKFFGEMVSNEWRKKPGIRTVYALTMFTFVTAMAMLSMIPHQEPRFLIPLTLPIVLMNAHKLRTKILGGKPLLFLWYMFNIAGLFFFGFTHQGGVTPFLRSNQELLPEISDGVKQVNIIFSHTYMPPKFPLLMPNSNESEITKWHFDYPLYYNKKTPKLNFIEMGSKPVEIDVKKKLIEVLLEKNKRYSTQKVKTFVALPTILKDKLEMSLENILTFTTVYYTFPHISVESLSEVSNLISREAFHFDLIRHWEELSDEIKEAGVSRYILRRFFSFFETIGLFGLSVIEVKLNTDTVKTVEVETIPNKEEKEHSKASTTVVKKAKRNKNSVHNQKNQ